MDIEQIAYRGWPNCFRLANEQLEMIVTTDVGPRVVSLALKGGGNVFAVDDSTAGLAGGDEWRAYGGHRLWHAPEDVPRTYYPDNSPVHIDHQDDFVRLTQRVESTTGIEKQMEISLDRRAARANLRHKLINHNLWSVELAPWALSVMAQGGVAIAPLPPRGTHPEDLLPNGNLVLWAYTNMSDPRWRWGKEYILLRQDKQAPSPQKIGLMPPQGWVAYANQGTLFVTTFEPQPGATYLDYGSALELFTNDAILEVETLGPLARLEPGASIEHEIQWHLYDGISEPRSDADVTQNLLPLIEAILAARD